MEINEPDYICLDQSKPPGRTAGNLVRAAIGEPTMCGACTVRTDKAPTTPVMKERQQVSNCIERTETILETAVTDK